MQTEFAFGYVYHAPFSTQALNLLYMREQLEHFKFKEQPNVRKMIPSIPSFYYGKRMNK